MSPTTSHGSPSPRRHFPPTPLGALLACLAACVPGTGGGASTDAGSLDAGAADAAVAPGPDAGATAPGPDAGATAPGPDAGPGADLNPGWIGGACSSADQCANDQALCATAGFPSGMCTAACAPGSLGTYVCPDQAGPFNTPSRCIDSVVEGPRCVSECDFWLSPTGCRPGYACVLRQRYQQPQSVFPVCLPAPGQAWPGESAPAFDVGEPCTGPADCAHLACLPLSSGYCTKTMCDTTGCPAGSTCFSLGETHACLRDCTTSAQCRQADGYACDADNTCWTAPTQRPPWDSSVGAPDCLAAWEAGLSSCDTVPDDYVVVSKHARNLALCQGGNLVANFSIGLGGPVGDKQREGDRKTPEGVFYVARLVDPSSYYLAFLISYPDQGDADRGLASGLIDQAAHDAIVAAQEQCREPPQDTALGSLIEIHGWGGDSDWTLGCVAIANSAMDQLWAAMAVGDTVVIKP